MSQNIDPYSVLGVSNNATPDEVKRAYRRLAQRLHPDTNPDNPGAAEQFQNITAAYEILADYNRRAQYDRESAQNRDPNDLYFTLRITPSKRAIAPLKESQVIYLLAEVFPAPEAQDVSNERESRLNLTLVLDHSNSMNGTRLEKVKIAAHQIIDSLTEQDVLSVITFNDRANTIIPATYVTDKAALKAKVSLMTAFGGTEIFQGLSSGVAQNEQFLGPKMVNHVILLTDGHTFGDSEKCLQLAAEAAIKGIGISAMGLGNDWNDKFLDSIASKTGGSSIYINSAAAVVRFLNNHVRQLSNAFAERMKMSVAPDPDVNLELAFKLLPNPQPLELDTGYIPLGSLQASRPISLLLQLQLPPDMPQGFKSIARLVASGDILQNSRQFMSTISDISIEVTEKLQTEEPPPVILDALSKLTLYRLQERAQEALENGNVVEATRRLENLATRLLEMGQEDLARQTLSEAQRVAHTSALSDKGQKALKYQTRALLLGSGMTNIIEQLSPADAEDND